MSFTVSDDAIRAMKDAANTLVDSKDTINEGVRSLSDTFEEHKEGLGAHSNDIHSLISELQSITSQAGTGVMKLNLKMNKAAAIRQRHIETNVYKSGIGSGTGSGLGGVVATGVAAGVAGGAAAGGLLNLLHKKKKDDLPEGEDHSNVPEIGPGNDLLNTAEPEKSVDDYINEWPKIKDSLPLREELRTNNPNYRAGSFSWDQNCQRCVPCFEMRRRGYDVEAMPRVLQNDYLSHDPYAVWENADVISCSGDGYDDVDRLMGQWGDGARAQITLLWTPMAGHTFFAERKNGITYFYDPQTGETAAGGYFNQCLLDSVKIARIDNLKPSKWIKECCKPKT